MPDGDVSRNDVVIERFRTGQAEAAADGAGVAIRSPASGEWVRLEGPAKRIWEHLEYPAPKAELVSALAAEFEADIPTISTAVDSVLSELSSKSIVLPADEAQSDSTRERYLWLLKRALSNLLYPELEMQIAYLERQGRGGGGIELQRHLRDIAARDPAGYTEIMGGKLEGTAPLRWSHTMIGLLRLNNIERCAERIFADGIPGDFLEAGVCQGGAAIFMRGLQVAYGQGERRTWVVDSFQGVPPSVDEADRRYQLHLEEARQPWLAFSEAKVRENFSRYDLLDDKVEFLPGWVSETLPGAPIGTLALLRLDVDLYSSTAECLEQLYDKVAPGGYVIVDDYGFLPCCRDAVDEFRSRRGITEPFERIDPSGIFWRTPFSPAGAGDA